MFRLFRITSAAALFFIALTASTAAAVLDFEVIAPKALSAITVVVVLAVLLESALTPLFNWRVFLTYFSLKGWRTIFMVAIAWILVSQFSINTVSTLIVDFGGTAPASAWFSQFVTAMILAGGSAGVFTLLKKLGVRVPEPEAEAQKPADDKAWIAVHVERVKAAGPVRIMISETAAASPLPDAIAGNAGARRPGLVQLLFRNNNRFPANGGYTVHSGKAYRISAEGEDAEGKPLPPVIIREQAVFAPKAIVDFDARI